MIKILVVSDLHPDVVTLGVPRFGEVERAFFQAISYALDPENKIDVFLFLGDLVDPDSGGATMKAIGMMISGVMQLTRGEIQTILLAGNHCVLDDGSGATVLTPLLALQDHVELLTVMERPARAYLGDNLYVLGLPYTSLARGVDVAKATKELWPKDGRVIVASHLSVPGVIPGEETNDMPRGRDILYPFEETKNAIVRLQGHYHRRQKFDPGDGGPPIRIPGSLARLDFNAEDHEPGFMVIEVP